MAMTVQIDLATTVTPTYAATTAVKWNRADTEATVVNIPTPTSTGTNFSWIKSFQPNITATGGLTMTDIKVGKVATEATTGTKVWYTSEHASYTQATAAPGATGDNNTTAPDINSGTGEAALPLISGASAYDAGPYSATGRQGNYIEICLGVDATNTTAGSAVATPTIRWEWTEA